MPFDDLLVDGLTTEASAEADLASTLGEKISFMRASSFGEKRPACVGDLIGVIGSFDGLKKSIPVDDQNLSEVRSVPPGVGSPSIIVALR